MASLTAGNMSAPEVHQLHYMDEWGWDTCSGTLECKNRTTYNCVTCKKLFCVKHGQEHGTILIQ